jgi:tetratricopeptide (TPR) repeat protein
VVPAAAVGEPLTFVNIASDGASGQHTTTVVADSLVQRDPLVEKSIKRLVILEEPSAHAPPTPKQVLGEVTGLLNQAKAAYNRGAIDSAVESLAQAEAMLLATEPLPETFSTLSELQRLTGLVALKQKDSNAADDAFRQAINLDPSLPQRDSAMGSYARVLKSHPPGTGKIDVRADPLTAWVLIDGQKADSGLSPAIEAGTHFVSASREGYTGQIQRVIVYKDKTVPVKISLQTTSNEPELLVTRNALLAAQSEASLALGAKRIAELTKARYVALVRSDEIALYDAKNTMLKSFEPIPEAADHMLVALHGSAPPPLITQEEVVAQKKASEQAQARAAASPTPEFLTNKWTYIGAGIGVVVITGVIVTAVVASSPTHLRYSVDNWCHAADCPPAN